MSFVESLAQLAQQKNLIMLAFIYLNLSISSFKMAFLFKLFEFFWTLNYDFVVW